MNPSYIKLCIADGLEYLGKKDIAVADVLQHYVERQHQCHWFNLADAFAQAMYKTYYRREDHPVIEKMIDHLMQRERQREEELEWEPGTVLQLTDPDEIVTVVEADEDNGVVYVEDDDLQVIEVPWDVAASAKRIHIN